MTSARRRLADLIGERSNARRPLDAEHSQPARLRMRTDEGLVGSRKHRRSDQFTYASVNLHFATPADPRSPQ